MLKRVVVTGIGVSSGIGNDVKSFYQNLIESRSGIGKVSIFDTDKYHLDIGSEVKNIDEALLTSERRLPRPVKFAVNSTREALNMSGVLDYVEPEMIGCYVAGSACQVFESERYYQSYVNDGFDKVKSNALFEVHWDNVVNETARRFNLRGPRNTILTACSSSGIAIGLGFDLIRLGEVKAMVVGGSDGFSEFTYSGFQSLNSASKDPCRPFDRDRKGLTFGEGAGILVLEDYDHAVKRGADILCEISGYGAVGEGYNLTSPHPDGLGYLKAMGRALKVAKISPDQVGHINAHGTATPVNDVVEGSAIKQVFKGRKIPVNSIKSLVGHCMGAAGGVEAVNCVLNLKHQIIPGTCNHSELEPGLDINVISETIEDNLDYILSNSAGFGGNNSSLLFKRFSA